jgi:hypothetical protein
MGGVSGVVSSVGTLLIVLLLMMVFRTVRGSSVLRGLLSLLGRRCSSSPLSSYSVAIAIGELGVDTGLMRFLGDSVVIVSGVDRFVDVMGYICFLKFRQESIESFV